MQVKLFLQRRDWIHRFQRGLTLESFWTWYLDTAGGFLLDYPSREGEKEHEEHAMRKRHYSLWIWPQERHRQKEIISPFPMPRFSGTYPTDGGCNSLSFKYLTEQQSLHFAKIWTRSGLRQDWHLGFSVSQGFFLPIEFSAPNQKWGHSEAIAAQIAAWLRGARFLQALYPYPV